MITNNSRANVYNYDFLTAFFEYTMSLLIAYSTLKNIKFIGPDGTSAIIFLRSLKHVLLISP